ncbi:MAG: ATP-binding protein [Acidimicrobiales bacterium]
MNLEGSRDLNEAQHAELWRAVLRTTVDPIIVIDDHGIVLTANAATDRLFGYAGEYLVGKNISILMPEPYSSEHDGYIARYLETGQAKIIGIGREVEAQKADGQVFPIALSISEIQLADRSWFTGVIHDLTDRRSAEDELRRTRDQLEVRVKQRTAELEESMIELTRSNRDLEQFAYIASHDLQTPLRNVRQGLELFDEHLQETIGHQLDDEARELRDLTVAAALKMEQLIQGLLSYSRLDRSGRPPRDPVDLRSITEELIDQMAVQLGEAHAKIEVAPLPTVAGDEMQLRQLLQNLLENAVKYRRDGEPLEIRMSAEAVDDQWLITIGDNGIGIDVGQRDRVFELFRRAHPGSEGMGLGLAICQRIVERHGGDIWVAAGPNGGSVFSFTIPKADV